MAMECDAVVGARAVSKWEDGAAADFEDAVGGFAGGGVSACGGMSGKLAGGRSGSADGSSASAADDRGLFDGVDGLRGVDRGAQRFAGWVDRKDRGGYTGTV